MAATRRDIMSIGLEDHDQLNMELGGGFPPGVSSSSRAITGPAKVQ